MQETQIKRFRFDKPSSTIDYDFEILDADEKILRLLSVELHYDLYTTGGARQLPETLVQELASDGWTVHAKDEVAWDAHYKHPETITDDTDIITHIDQ